MPEWTIANGHASYVSAVHRIVHDGDPSLEDGHLEQAEVGPAHVVEGHTAVLPSQVVLLAHGLVRDHLGTGHQPSLVYTLQNKWKLNKINYKRKLFKSALEHALT